MNLVIISDTPMTREIATSQLLVFEPTLREVESVSGLFGRTIWFGYSTGTQQLASSRTPATLGIELRLFPTVRGGESFFSKLRIVFVLPFLTWTIIKAIRRSDIVHTRGPSVPAAICIALSWLFRKKIYWHKYAGNWMEPNAPFMYAFQRWMLQRASHCHVTVNGIWMGQRRHIRAFENPCFTNEELEHANLRAATKSFNGTLTFCFAGHLTEAKGVLELFKAIRILCASNVRPFRFIFSGDGPLLDSLRMQSHNIGIEAEFTGYLKRESLNEVYESSHALILPSRTEGFPKVVAECAAFGCIPMVTDVSAIGQYVMHGQNGFLLEDNRPETIAKGLRELLFHPDLKAISQEAVRMSKNFTYERFISKIADMLSIPSKD